MTHHLGRIHIHTMDPICRATARKLAKRTIRIPPVKPSWPGLFFRRGQS